MTENQSEKTKQCLNYISGEIIRTCAQSAYTIYSREFCAEYNSVEWRIYDYSGKIVYYTHKSIVSLDSTTDHLYVASHDYVMVFEISSLYNSLLPTKFAKPIAIWNISQMFGGYSDLTFTLREVICTPLEVFFNVCFNNQYYVSRIVDGKIEDFIHVPGNDVELTLHGENIFAYRRINKWKKKKMGFSICNIYDYDFQQWKKNITYPQQLIYNQAYPGINYMSKLSIEKEKKDQLKQWRQRGNTKIPKLVVKPNNSGGIYPILKSNHIVVYAFDNIVYCLVRIRTNSKLFHQYVQDAANFDPEEDELLALVKYELPR